MGPTKKGFSFVRECKIYLACSSLHCFVIGTEPISLEKDNGGGGPRKKGIEKEKDKFWFFGNRHLQN